MVNENENSRSNTYSDFADNRRCGYLPLALDYEAKPISGAFKRRSERLVQCPGALVMWCRLWPIDGGYHGSLEGTKHVAGKFGDEKVLGQTCSCCADWRIRRIGLVADEVSVHGIAMAGNWVGTSLLAAGPT